MKRIISLFLLLALAGCVTTRDQQRLGSNSSSYHYQMGLSFLKERNFTSALIELTEADKLDPENPDIVYNLGLAYVGKRRPDLAEPLLLKATRLKPANSAARNDLGVAYLDLKRWDNAIQQFKIVKDDLFYQNSESAAINLGLAYLGKGDYAKSLEELRSVAVSNQRNPVVHVSLGRVWFAMDKLEQAISAYKKALEIYPDYGAAYYYLGQAYLKRSAVDAARSAFKEAARIIPDSDLGRSSLEYLDLLK